MKFTKRWSVSQRLFKQISKAFHLVREVFYGGPSPKQKHKDTPPTCAAITTSDVWRDGNWQELPFGCWDEMNVWDACCPKHWLSVQFLEGDRGGCAAILLKLVLFPSCYFLFIPPHCLFGGQLKIARKPCRISEVHSLHATHLAFLFCNVQVLNYWSKKKKH